MFFGLQKALGQYLSPLMHSFLLLERQGYIFITGLTSCWSHGFSESFTFFWWHANKRGEKRLIDRSPRSRKGSQLPCNWNVDSIYRKNSSSTLYNHNTFHIKCSRVDLLLKLKLMFYLLRSYYITHFSSLRLLEKWINQQCLNGAKMIQKHFTCFKKRKSTKMFQQPQRWILIM